MPLAWYITLLLIAGACALGDLILRGRFALRTFAVTTLLALVGALMGWALGYGLALPEIVQLRVEGHAFPLVWTFVGAVTFLGTLDLVERRNRRKAAAGRPVQEILSDAAAVRR